MESMEYEMARNMTLLFFLERLLDKGEPRTVHDLSCQFGNKEFTKEMRQIAGGSQSGKLPIHSEFSIISLFHGVIRDIIRWTTKTKRTPRNTRGYRGDLCFSDLLLLLNSLLTCPSAHVNAIVTDDG